MFMLKIVWFCWILRTNCGVGSELVFAVELWCQQRISFCCQIVVSAANYWIVFSKVWISFRCWIMVLAANQLSLLDYGVGSKSVLCCRQRISFCCQIMLFARIQFSLPNCGVNSESVFGAEWWRHQWTGFVNHHVFQRISSLTNPRHQRTSFVDNPVFQRINSLTNPRH